MNKVLVHLHTMVEPQTIINLNLNEEQDKKTRYHKIQIINYEKTAK